MKERFDYVKFSCDPYKVLGSAKEKVLQLSDDELDLFCEQAGVVWEKTSDNGIHIHGCGMNCVCHGGLDNPNLRPRPICYSDEFFELASRIWRFDMLGKGYGSYQEIDEMVQSGKLTPFQDYPDKR